MDQVKPIELGTNHNNKKEAAFIAVTCVSDIWRNYNEIPKELRNVKVPMVIMIDRWDGTKGFVGGNVEKGESLLNAALREFYEEVNYKIKPEQIIDSTIVASHETPKLVTHLINVEVSEDVIREILASAHKAEHFLSEVAGVSAIPFINYPNAPAFDNFIKNSFAKTVKEEIADLIITKKWHETFNLPIDFVPEDKTQLALRKTPKLKI